MSLAHPFLQNPSPKIARGFALLLEAHRYAEDIGCPRWDFAVEVQRLQTVGMNESDLRWITMKGYAQHACEVTATADEQRMFQHAGGWLLKKNSCFVLSDSGVAEARRMISHIQATEQRQTHPHQSMTPHWDSNIRELHMCGHVVKRFKWQAVNQETVLSAFQEDGWPAVIDDPLPPKPEQDPRRRLHDTIKALNRNQLKPTIRFRGNGTGEGIRWEPVNTDKAISRLNQVSQYADNL